ncbi:MAG: cell division protein FtsQ/DivIB, partial [Parahaliea sp.]
LSPDHGQVRSHLEALARIYQATVGRRWPNTLKIDVVEQLALARWVEGGLLNHDGQVVATADEAAWQHLPRLQGPAGSQGELMASYQQLDEQLHPLALSVQVLVLDLRGQLRATLDNGIELMLGDADFRERVQRFMAVYEGELGPRVAQVERVDLRYHSGLAVAFHEPVQVAGVAGGNTYQASSRE